MVEDNETINNRNTADTKKYLTYQKNKIHAIEIINAVKGDSAAYQFSLDNMKSNKIHTFVDGKYSLLY